MCYLKHYICKAVISHFQCNRIGLIFIQSIIIRDGDRDEETPIAGDGLKHYDKDMLSQCFLHSIKLVKQSLAW